mmetsp:Transcript_16101/g.20594  ORF Transcript_16101/g.20594 Transcript_16101/m.20594 type:complete len:223 (-) Transcript_16101:28-696(-)
MSACDSFDKTSQNKVKRLPKKGKYDKESVYRVLDEGLVCHVGFCTDDGPIVIPMAYGRDADVIYLHGSTASRMTKANKTESPVCCTVTLLDGLVIARSLFNHSMAYRSVVVFGTANEVSEEEERNHALQVITDHIIPGRWEDARAPSPAELKATRVLKVSIESASLKESGLAPDDDKKDITDNAFWAGSIPIHTVFGEATPDQSTPPSVDCPANISSYQRGK